jgi:hypothetical protein
MMKFIHAREKSHNFNCSHSLVVMHGDDFRYEMAESEFTNLENLMSLMRSKPEFNDKYKI